ncbi:unnamed protein product, partial [Brenthis ino]
MNLSSVSKNIEPQEYRKFPLKERCTRFESVYGSNNLNLSYNVNQIQKNTVKSIRECSILNLYNTTTKLYKNKTSKFVKPVLVVTVIPKHPTIRISKVFNKQKHYKKVQNTFSNYENSVQNLNLYSSKGKRRPKVSKVKTSESDILYNKHNSKYADITLDLLNMERNKRKYVKTNRLKDIKNKECFCKAKEDYKLEDKNAQKNRVTIVGQLGLTQDERYVLKCAATVNDKPIPTNFSQVSNSPDRPNMKQAFANEQATQATQVNFNFSHNNPKKAYKNQIVQCNCTESKVETTMSRTNVLKESKSPLVVISVYPIQDETGDIDTSPVKIIQHKNLQDRYKVKTQYNNFKNNEKQNNGRTLSSNKMVRTRNSRSPSPVNIAKKVSTKRTAGTNTFAINTRKQSPGRQGNRSKLPSKPDDLKIDLSHTVKQQSDNLKNKKAKFDVEHVKKALVSSFIKNIEKIDKDVSKRKFIAPKDDASKVTINIEGDNENYDVMFERSEFDTGVSVRKTAKVNKKYKSNNEAGVSSMENFLMLSDDAVDQPNYVRKIITTQSKLNVRDSLEINHRRERGSSSLKPNNNEFKKSGKNDSNVFAQVKHFRGDNCSLTDPNDRDREIRELLGVIRDSRKSKISTDVQDKDRYCVKKCSKSIMTGLSITNILQTKINKNGNSNAKVHNQKLFSKENYLNKFTNANELTLLNKSPNSHDIKDPITSQNLILNRNIQVFLQLEQFNKSRPIILNRKQYNKVKRTIQCTISKKLSVDKNYRNGRNHSIVSIGEIKARSKHLPLHFDREVQTERTEIKRILRNSKKRRSVQTRENNKSGNKINAAKSINDASIDIYRGGKEKYFVENNKFRKVVSSIEIRYTSVEYMKHTTTSSAHVAENERKSFHRIRQDNSIHTIFKGYRRSVTPNLGTSAFSLDSDRTDSNNSIRPSGAGDFKAKKPFLRRLISCLVMRSPPDSAFKRTLPLQGRALEMSSSLYDTSASFYSNHATFPINKMKRGFFTSVREFLTSRRT